MTVHPFRPECGEPTSAAITTNGGPPIRRKWPPDKDSDVLGSRFRELEGHYQVSDNSTLAAVVEGSGTGVVAHVGLRAPGSVVDRLWLGDSLLAAIPITGERLPTHHSVRCPHVVVKR